VALFLVGNLGGKLAALECAALLQLTALLQFTLRRMTPTFAALAPLAVSLGWVPLGLPSDYYETNELPASFKGMRSDRNSLLAMNYSLCLLALPLLAALFLKVLAVRRPSNVHLPKAWKNALGTYMLYPLLFLAYGELAGLAISVRFFALEADAMVSVLVGCLFLIALVGYLIALYKQR
jgi:hypothetical protein